MKTIQEANKPLISIIIVVFNGREFIEAAIKSVIDQDYNKIEIIIVDGKSTDGTIDIVKKYFERLDQIISEPDSGIYDAMNKGIKISKGEWLYFLGSDDQLFTSTIISSIFENNVDGSISIIFGNVSNDQGKLIRSRLDWKIILHNTLHHQSAFYRRSLFNNFSYDVGLKIISDYELNLISYLSKVEFVKVDRIVAMCRDGGASTNKANSNLFLNETNFIRSKHIGGIVGYLLRLLFVTKCRVHDAIRYFSI
jgi:putative colanic acid biosynthesis glycosyltransferase